MKINESIHFGDEKSFVPYFEEITNRKLFSDENYYNDACYLKSFILDLASCKPMQDLYDVRILSLAFHYAVDLATTSETASYVWLDREMGHTLFRIRCSFVPVARYLHNEGCLCDTLVGEESFMGEVIIRIRFIAMVILDMHKRIWQKELYE